MKFGAARLMFLLILSLGVLLPGRMARSQNETDARGEARIQKLLVERRDTLRQLLELIEKQSRIGKAGLDDVIHAQIQLFDAELALTDKKEERLQICENRVKALQKLEELMKTRNVDGKENFSKALLARAARLEAEILLVREQLSAK